MKTSMAEQIIRDALNRKPSVRSGPLAGKRIFIWDGDANEQLLQLTEKLNDLGAMVSSSTNLKIAGSEKDGEVKIVDDPLRLMPTELKCQDPQPDAIIILHTAMPKFEGRHDEYPLLPLLQLTKEKNMPTLIVAPHTVVESLIIQTNGARPIPIDREGHFDVDQCAQIITDKIQSKNTPSRFH